MLYAVCCMLSAVCCTLYASCFPLALQWYSWSCLYLFLTLL
jgi:hypothetical protein